MGRRSGKSYCAAYEVMPYLLTPNTRGWVVSKTYDLADKITRIIKEELFIKMKIPMAAKRQIGGQLFYVKVAGLNSELWVKSAENTDQLLGEGLDYMIIDEASKIPQRTWEQYLRPTLSDRNGWAAFVSTPEGFNHFADLWQRGQDPSFPDWESWQFPSWESPFFKDDIEELKKTLTKETFEQEFNGSFVSYAGKVYGDFSRESNVRSDLKYNPELPLWASCDFGYRQPSVGYYQIDRIDGQEVVYLIDEISHETEITTAELISMIKAKGYAIDKWVGDPAGGQRQSQTGETDIQQFAKARMRINYKKDKHSRNIVNGINHVRNFIKSADGTVRFFVSDKCTGHIQDFENYRYPERKDQRILKEEPLKDGFYEHGCDEMRYFFINYFPIKRKKAFLFDF